MSGRQGCIVEIYRHISAFSYLAYRKDEVGEQNSARAIVFLLFHVFVFWVNWFHRRGLLGGSGRLWPLLRIFWGVHHCGALTRVAPHNLAKKSSSSAGRKTDKELFTPSNPCQCCELGYFCSPWQLHDFLTSDCVLVLFYLCLPALLA